MPDNFERTLDRFMDICRKLAREGQAYTAVILCHEYFRFLFPWEPYEKFKNTDPYHLTLKRLKQLTMLGEAWRLGVAGYAPRTEELKAGQRTLESRTSDLYGSLWKRFDEKTLWNESLHLVRRRLPKEIIQEEICGKRVLDMGCGSGRYTVALARLGARVTGADLDKNSYAAAKNLCRKKKLPVSFVEANFHRLPFKSGEFDFVFCNGTLHHSSSIEKGLSELHRVLKPGGRSFLYLYADGGVFWLSRRKMREFFKDIPAVYTDAVLKMIGMPGHRFIFQDVWYVPKETHTSRRDLEAMLKRRGFSFKKLISTNAFDLDMAIACGTRDAVKMWGDGEHRYLLEKK